MTTFSTPAGISTVNSFVDQILSAYDPETVLEVLGATQDAWPAQYYNSDTHVSYTPHNDAERRAVYSDTPRNVLIKGGEGGGKALKTDTSLPTPMGWITMGEIQTGDLLFDERGEICRVLTTSLIMYDHDCYEIVFSDGQRIVADAEHLWLTADFRTRKSLGRRGEKYTTGTHAHLPHCQPKYDPELRTTREILHTLRVPRGDNNHSIQLTESLKLPPADLPIDPWLLGAWLGDGTSRSPQITIG
ncbi:MAG: hypothetical protein KAU10_04840, partial [Dehalococcoidia bacterium]|nr:hypothetical protein [Dehalococcoidia bacterium]